MNRIDSLDWQRGLLAFSVMCYHLFGSKFDSSFLLARLGIYAVSMFFVLSGLSMALVYNKYIQGFGSTVKFFVRRIFRIWPLLWLAVACVTVVGMLTGQAPDWRKIVLNLTTAFAFIEPTAYMNVGAWSIGNEMVYYALTPAIIYTFNRSIVFGNLLTLVTAVVGGWFAVSGLSLDATLAEQWPRYINPFNNLFLYCAGIALFYNFHQTTFSKGAVGAIFTAGLLLLLLYPATGDQINIVTGVARAGFSLASVLLVLAFYKNTFAVPQIVAGPLTRLGVVTYGVYLFHMVVYGMITFVLEKIHMHLSGKVLVAMTIPSTIIMALISFRFLEEPFIRLGKRLTSSKKNGSSASAAIRAS